MEGPLYWPPRHSTVPFETDPYLAMALLSSGQIAQIALSLRGDRDRLTTFGDPDIRRSISEVRLYKLPRHPI